MNCPNLDKWGRCVTGCKEIMELDPCKYNLSADSFSSCHCNPNRLGKFLAERAIRVMRGEIPAEAIEMFNDIKILSEDDEESERCILELNKRQEGHTFKCAYIIAWKDRPCQCGFELN